MNKAMDKVLTLVFVCFIFILALLFVLLPKSDFSVNEKRDLAQAPDIKNILNGKFESGAEDYLTDHFPFRDGWVAVNSYFSLYTGRNGTSGVYKGHNGYLINDPLTSDDKSFNENIAAIKSFCQKTDVPVTVMIVPTTGSVMTDMLPLNHAPYNDDEYIDRAKSELENVNFIDLRDKFRELVSDGVQIYYKTDHHWTSRGAYEAYRLLAENGDTKNTESPETAAVREADEFTIEKRDGFYGTTYSKSALWGEKGEMIELWTYPANVNVTIKDGDKEKTSDDMFFRSHLDEADKYPVFLDGNHSYVRIENKDAGDGKTLIVKDSYAHCLAPFIAYDTHITDMVDLRYYFDSVSELVKNEGYDRVLIVYGLENLVEYNDAAIIE